MPVNEPLMAKLGVKVNIKAVFLYQSYMIYGKLSTQQKQTSVQVHIYVAIASYSKSFY